jgi:hypothetical protein
MFRMTDYDGIFRVGTTRIRSASPLPGFTFMDLVFA